MVMPRQETILGVPVVIVLVYRLIVPECRVVRMHRVHHVMMVTQAPVLIAMAMIAHALARRMIVPAYPEVQRLKERLVMMAIQPRVPILGMLVVIA